MTYVKHNGYPTGKAKSCMLFLDHLNEKPRYIRQQTESHAFSFNSNMTVTEGNITGQLSVLDKKITSFGQKNDDIVAFFPGPMSATVVTVNFLFVLPHVKSANSIPIAVFLFLRGEKASV